MTDEELDAKFAELFGDAEIHDGEGETDPVVVEESEPEAVEPEVEDTVETHELKYELSHDDIRYALYNLMAAQDEDNYYYTWIIDVYDSKFIYQDCRDNKCYRQKYSKDGDNIAFDDDPIEVFSEWLSKEEKDALDALKSDYATLKEFKDNYDTATVKAEKDAIFAKPEYECLANDDAFKALVNNAENYSVEEIEAKVKSMFADHVIKIGTFSFNKETKSKINTIGFNFNANDTEEKPAYGGLFDED